MDIGVGKRDRSEALLVDIAMVTQSSVNVGPDSPGKSQLAGWRELGLRLAQDEVG